MSNIKKIIGVVLALVMALSVATVAFAAPEDNYSVTLTADKTELQAGETATVEVKVTSNFNVCAMSIPVFFDNTKVTVTGVATATDATEAANTVVASKDSATHNNLAKYYKNTGYTEADHGVVALIYIAQVGNKVRTYSNETVMKLTVTALADVSGEAVVECLSTSVKTDAKPLGTLYVGKSSAATVSAEPEIVDNADVTSAKATIKIAGAAEPADLELKAAATAGIVIDTHKTFGGEYDGAVYGFTQAAANTFMTNNYLRNNLQATNEGTLEFARPNGKTSGGFGTGSLVKVNNADGTLSKTYVVVIFGDVDQNGMITAADTTTVKGWATKPTTAPANNTLLRMAANTAFVNNATVLHNIQTNDTTALKNFVTKNANANTDLLKLNPVKLAEAQAKFNTFYQ